MTILRESLIIQCREDSVLMRGKGFLEVPLILIEVLHCFDAGFACSYLYNVLDVINEDLAVADMSGVKNLLGSFDYRGNGNRADYNVNLYLRQEVSFDLYAAVVFGLTLLSAAAENVRYCHTGDADTHHSILESLKTRLLADDFDLPRQYTREALRSLRTRKAYRAL